MIKVSLKDGVVKEFDAGITAAEVAKNLGMGLYKAACVCRIDGEVADLRTVLDKDCALEILTFDDEEGKKAFRHTALLRQLKDCSPQQNLLSVLQSKTVFTMTSM